MKGAPVFVGTSGWYYDHWEGVLYPPRLPKARRFEVYARQFRSVEINATYYRLPSASMVEGWYVKAPPGFMYAVKAQKEITHNRRLRNADEPLRAFLHAIAPLKKKLGAVLFQLPPSLKRDVPLLRDFVGMLPKSPQCCFEFRDASWECDETYATLERAGVGHVVVGKKDYPFVEQHTGDVAYYRLHGPEKMFASAYSDAWLEALGDRIVSLVQSSVKCFVFFNNDIGGHAVRNALKLDEYLTELLKRGERTSTEPRGGGRKNE